MEGWILARLQVEIIGIEPYSEGLAFGINIGDIDGVQHVVEVRNLAISVGDLFKQHFEQERYQLVWSTRAYNWELNIGLGAGIGDGTKLIDIFNPLVMALESVGRQANDLDTALGKISLATSDFAELYIIVQDTLGFRKATSWH